MSFQAGKSAVRASLVVSLAALTLAACAGERQRPQLRYQERPLEALYDAGERRLQQQRWADAVDYFQEVERQHPYSEWSRRAILMQLYAHYMGNQYEEAIADANRFITLYPGSPSAPYAFYMKAICSFEQIVDVGRDQATSLAAMQGLRDVVARYPNTAYARDALVKIDMVNDQLGGKEMAIGRWYQRQNQPIAAVGRYKAVLERYQTTSHTPEALYRLVELNLTLGLRDEAVRNAVILGHNFPGDRWYRDAYALLTREGARPDVAPDPNGARGPDAPQEQPRRNWLSRLMPGRG
ncbi:MAG TPA: outer membrane protein assembly factor BamD [Caulobacteraceae bacterium]|jgi:outer membrane protein assembly factor BamD